MIEQRQKLIQDDLQEQKQKLIQDDLKEQP